MFGSRLSRGMTQTGSRVQPASGNLQPDKLNSRAQRCGIYLFSTHVTELTCHLACVSCEAPVEDNGKAVSLAQKYVFMA